MTALIVGTWLTLDPWLMLDLWLMLDPWLMLDGWLMLDPWLDAWETCWTPPPAPVSGESQLAWPEVAPISIWIDVCGEAKRKQK